MSETPKKLLSVIEFIEHAQYPVLYKAMGFEVTTEWQVRKAVALIRKMKPDVIVADFYFQSDFRDRLSNLESLLAATQLLKDFRVLVFYEPHNEHALERVRERMRIDAALPMPASEHRAGDQINIAGLAVEKNNSYGCAGAFLCWRLTVGSLLWA